jgi:hypothetical protein
MTAGGAREAAQPQRRSAGLRRLQAFLALTLKLAIVGGAALGLFLIGEMEGEISVKAFEDVILSWGHWGVLASIGLMVLHSFVPFPAELVGLANGMLCGPVWGTVITWVGAMLGAFLAFGLSRAFGGPDPDLVVDVRMDNRLRHLTDDRPHGGHGRPGGKDAMALVACAPGCCHARLDLHPAMAAPSKRQESDRDAVGSARPSRKTWLNAGGARETGGSATPAAPMMVDLARGEPLAGVRHAASSNDDQRGPVLMGVYHSLLLPSLLHLALKNAELREVRERTPHEPEFALGCQQCAAPTGRTALGDCMAWRASWRSQR